MSTKLISWNVNGLRAVLRKEALTWLVTSQPDILCLQETKCRPDQIDPILPDYPFQYWNSAEKKGYSGTVVFSRLEPLSVNNGIGIAEHDNEGRVITLEFPEYFLVTVYTPNAKRELLRLEYRVHWDIDFLNFLKRLEKRKPVVFCGDLNVAHQEIDLAHPESNHRNAGFTDEERLGFTNLVEAEFIDSFREFVQDGGHYTWWSMITRARERNAGWRIDYFCLSSSLRPRLKDAFILPDIMGSDHCPVGILLD